MKSQRWLACLAGVVLLGFAVLMRSQPQRLHVGIFVYEGVYNTEFIAPLDVLNHAATHTGGRLVVFTVSPRFGSVTTAEGLRVLPQYSRRAGYRAAAVDSGS